MYEWRRMTPGERRRVLALRRAARRPWHRPPHEDRGEGDYHVTAACYEHAPFIGTSPARMAECEHDLLDSAQRCCEEVHAWCVLPNHYHLLVETRSLEAVTTALGRFHGRKSFQWNGQDNARGRQVWHRCSDRGIRSEGHFWAVMNYVHHNPVHHGYVARWEDWPFSSARRFLTNLESDGGSQYGYLDPAPRKTTTAIGLLMRMYTGWGHDHPALGRGVRHLSRWGPSPETMYHNYYATQVMHHWGGPLWEKWNAAMRDSLVASQASHGPEAGSWFFPDDPGAEEGGRLYCAAMAIMTLEVYYRYMPLYRSDALEDGF